MNHTRLFAIVVFLSQPWASAQLSQALLSLLPENPWMAAGRAAAEHNDAYSSNVSPRLGPGKAPSASP